jgi:hypothetical protein
MNEKSKLTTQTHQLRKEISLLSKAVDHLLMNTDSGQLTIINMRHSAAMAKGWLGKLLGVLKEKSPYKPADAAENIPPTADAVDTLGKWDVPLPDSDAHTAYINALRYEIKRLINWVNKLEKDYYQTSTDEFGFTCIEMAAQHLHECSMNGGFQLAHIRDLALIQKEKEK